MKQDNFLRLAAVLRGVDAQTTSNSLLRLIKNSFIVNSNSKLNLTQLVKSIQNEFDMAFEENELLKIIRCNENEFEIARDKDPVLTSFSLKPNEYQKFKDSIDSQSSLDRIVGRFKKACKHIPRAHGTCKNIILHFLYQSFCGDVNIIRGLFQNDTNGLDVDEFLKERTDEEKLIINEFLNWENTEKDQFVFNAISCGFEYCSLSSCKDIADINQIFYNKIFYLDANIIFRLMGLNNIERQSVIEAFIKKCNDSEIKLAYTNFTQNEIESTIRYHVKKISDYYGTATAIRGEFIRAICPKYANVDFLTAYHDWSVLKGNRYGDYSAFSNFLLQKAESILQKFELVKMATHKSGKEQGVFGLLVKELEVYKQKYGKYTYQASLETDIDNYMTVLSRCGDTAKDVLNTDHYIISTDHPYVTWARDRIPGVVPIIVLPSVWYSLLLKFKGRSDNDFRAFSQFMNQRLSWNAEDDPRADKILRQILSLRETQPLKESIALKVSQNLKGKYKDYDDEVEIINDAKEYVLSKEIANVKAELESKDLRERQELETRHQQILAENARVSLEANEESWEDGSKSGEKRGYDQGKKTGLTEGASNREKEMYDLLCKNAPQKISAKLWLIRATFIAYIFCSAFLIIAWSYCRFCLPETSEWHKRVLIFAPTVATLISLLMSFSGIAGWKYIKNNLSRKKLEEKYIEEQCKDLKIDRSKYGGQ